MSAGSSPLLCSIPYRYCPCHIFLKIASSFLPPMTPLEWDDSSWKYGLTERKIYVFILRFQSVGILSRGRFRVIDKLFSGVADNSSQFASEESSLADRELRSASWHFCYKHESLLMLKHLRSITSLNMKFNSPQTLRILSLILNNFIIKSCVNLPSQT